MVIEGTSSESIGEDRTYKRKKEKELGNQDWTISNYKSGLIMMISIHKNGLIIADRLSRNR